MTPRSTRVLRTALGGIVLTAGMLLTSCGDDTPGELADVRWQVSRIQDAALDDSGTAVASSLSQSDQARTWLVVGGTTVTGAAGCMSLRGDVEWLDRDRVKLHDLSARDTSGDHGSPDCLPNDSSLADRLTDILGHSGSAGDDEPPTLRWSTPTEDELRLARTDDSPSSWQTGRFIEFLATP